jgi:hypothetical protein
MRPARPLRCLATVKYEIPAGHRSTRGALHLPAWSLAKAFGVRYASQQNAYSEEWGFRGY